MAINLKMERWATGYYRPSEQFVAVEEHTAVMGKNDCRLIAVTGPSRDAESEAHARLMAAAPRMAEILLDLCAGDDVAHDEICAVLTLAGLRQ